MSEEGLIKCLKDIPVTKFMPSSILKVDYKAFITKKTIKSITNLIHITKIGFESKRYMKDNVQFIIDAI